jgi:UDP-N-acetylglucosamine acyltransferase
VLGVHQFVKIGRLAMIGGMTRIDRDVPPFMLVEGNPARVRALNKVGLQRSGLVSDPEVQSTLKKAFRLIYRSRLPLAEAVAQIQALPANEALSHLQEFLTLAQKEGRRGLVPGLRPSTSKTTDAD